MRNYRNIYQTARELKGLTQEAAAERLDISVDSLGAYEQDRRRPPDSTVLRMAQLYDFPYLCYHKSIKRGKLHTRNGAMRIRVYSGDPIAHLIEGGWTPRARDGSRGTKQPGKGIFEKSYEAFAPEYESDAEEMIDEMIRKI